MRLLEKLTSRLRGIIHAMIRYPFTVLFLIGTVVFIASFIELEIDYSKQLLTCGVGAVLCASFQSAYERFFEKITARLFLMGIGCVLTLGYYLILLPAPKLSMEIGIRTVVVVFILFVSFIWLPVIRSQISFNESFLAAFKAFFHSIFYSVVLYFGCCLVILAIDKLLVEVNSNVYPHTANIIFVLFAPLFFLSKIPEYPGKKNKRVNIHHTHEHDETIDQAANCPKFLEILISYIIIPVATVFTGILVIYIIQNIRGEFWADNLMEPMLVSYAISVILIYILCSRMENNSALLFRLVIPKLLIPIVIVQILATVVNMREMGVTYSRYFVLSFGIFAVFAGVVMSVLPVRKNGIIAGLLLVFSLETIIPPLDAFTVSRHSQENILRTTLVQNDMLKNRVIKPDETISVKDKKKIVSSVNYLSKMGYISRLTWLPEDFMVSSDFYHTFGFYDYEVPDRSERFVNLMNNTSNPIQIAGYDVLAHINITSRDDETSPICDIEKMGKRYVLEKKRTGDTYDILLLDDKKQEMVRFHINDILAKYNSYRGDKTEITNEEATFSNENNQAKMTIVIHNISISNSDNQVYYTIDSYILIGIK